MSGMTTETPTPLSEVLLRHLGDCPPAYDIYSCAREVHDSLVRRILHDGETDPTIMDGIAEFHQIISRLPEWEPRL